MISTATAAATGPGKAGAEHLTFEDGLLGFPQCRSFRLLTTQHHGLYWLESTDCAPLAFLLADPFLYFDGYSIDLNSADLALLQPEGSSDIAVLATVTLTNTKGATANLQGPIAINLVNGRARQIIVSNTGFGVREPIGLDFAGVAAD